MRTSCMMLMFISGLVCASDLENVIESDALNHELWCQGASRKSGLTMERLSILKILRWLLVGHTGDVLKPQDRCNPNIEGALCYLRNHLIMVVFIFFSIIPI